MFLCGFIYFFLILFVNPSFGKSETFDVTFQWNYLNFSFRSQDDIAKIGYNAGNDIIAGIKIYEDIMFMALPKQRNGSSKVTMAFMNFKKAQRKNPLLDPFPNWEEYTQGKNNCSTLQNVMSMEIDNDGIMWVLDGKRNSGFTKCPAKIVLYDLRSFKKISSFDVPKELCSIENKCFLNDLVVNGKWAYIADTTQTDPGILIYNRVLGSAWKARDNATMWGNLKAADFKAQGVQNDKVGHINAIALSPGCEEDNKAFYYSPHTSYHIYSIKTQVLHSRMVSTGNISKYIRDDLVKEGSTGGMICDSKSYVYFGLLAQDEIQKWNTRVLVQEAATVEQNREIIKWPDSYTFDNDGNLYIITNSMLKFSLEGIDLNETNFRVIRLHTGTKSYTFCGRK